MSQENKNKNKIAIIGHTKGIGKAIADIYKTKKYTVVGLSRSNGYDLLTDQEKIMEQIQDCHLVVINANAGLGQMQLLKRIYGKHSFNDMKVAVITSTSGTDEGQDANEFKIWNKFEYIQYCEVKNKLIAYISKLQEAILRKPLSV